MRKGKEEKERKGERGGGKKKGRNRSRRKIKKGGKEKREAEIRAFSCTSHEVTSAGSRHDVQGHTGTRFALLRGRKEKIVRSGNTGSTEFALYFPKYI